MRKSLRKHAGIDSLLRYLLRSICTHLAGESAGGTLWLRDTRHEGYRLRLVLRNGVVLSTKKTSCLSIPGLQLLLNELPGSGEPACCAGHGLERWLSTGVRAFASLPVTLDREVIGCFVIWLNATDALPTPRQVEWAASLGELALQAIQASRAHREPI